MAGSQPPPIVWHEAQVFAVIGAVVCALAPAGEPLAAVPLWQVVQLSAAVIPACENEVGNQAVVRWQLLH